VARRWLARNRYAFAAPGVEIQQAMTKVRAQVNGEANGKQSPMGNTNLVGEVYLNPVGVAPTPAK
jgi:hypothetical protein